MNPEPELHDERASGDELLAHLRACDADFVPPLSQRVDLAAYADKLLRHALRVEAWHQERLVGLVALYCNDSEGHCAFVTSVSVEPALRGTGLARRLVARACERARATGMKRARLELHPDNSAARRLYERAGFAAQPGHGAILTMELAL
jgi:ribosomal protein S18 acetylase RimI-like enzyme